MKRLLSIALLCPSLVLAAPAPSQPAMAPPLPAHADATPLAIPPARKTDQVKAAEAAKTADAPAEAAVIPQAFPRDRYEASWQKNPFLLKTAPVVQTKESWGTDYALTSIAKISGTYRVSIKNKKTGESKRLTEGSDAPSEFKIVNVNLQPDRKSSSVEVEKGGEKVSLTYDAAMMTPQARGGVPGAGRPGMPTIPGQPGGNIPTPMIRTTATGGAQSGGQMAGQNGIRMQLPTTSGSYQQPQNGGGSPGYMGNSGGAYGGGVGSVPGGSNVAGGNTAASRLGALGPRAGVGGTQQNSLVPTVGGTRVTGSNSYNGGTSVNGISGIVDPGNVTVGATDSTASGTTTTSAGTTTQVTRRRTLIPAPVVNP